jgi:radical SAM superfamily enzyme YgiQ (UPF0313 family)
MDILLINVPAEIGKKKYDIHNEFSRGINFGLLSIASYLQRNHYETMIYDIYKDFNISINEIISLIDYHKPYIIGLSCISGFAYPLLYKVTNLIKRRFHSLFIIVGGKDNIGFFPINVLKECECIDMVVMGEGEVITEKILLHVKSNKSFENIPNITYRSDNGKIKTNKLINLNMQQLMQFDYSLYDKYKEFAPSIENKQRVFS